MTDTPMTAERLAELKALCDAATEGPWTIARCAANRHSWRIYEAKNRPNGLPAAIATTAMWIPSDPEEESEANARLIAESRTAVPELIAEVERLRKDLDSAIEGYQRCFNASLTAPSRGNHEA